MSESFLFSSVIIRNFLCMICKAQFPVTIPEYKQAFKAIQMFKDEYLLDYLNVEQLGMRDEDIDEKVIENQLEIKYILINLVTIIG